MLFQKVIYGNIIDKGINGNIVNMMPKIIEHIIYNNILFYMSLFGVCVWWENITNINIV